MDTSCSLNEGRADQRRAPPLLTPESWLRRDQNRGIGCMCMALLRPFCLTQHFRDAECEQETVTDDLEPKKESLGVLFGGPELRASISYGRTELHPVVGRVLGRQMRDFGELAELAGQQRGERAVGLLIYLAPSIYFVCFD